MKPALGPPDTRMLLIRARAELANGWFLGWPIECSIDESDRNMLTVRVDGAFHHIKQVEVR